jgi:hypothetical protein
VRDKTKEHLFLLRIVATYLAIGILAFGLASLFSMARAGTWGFVIGIFVGALLVVFPLADTMERWGARKALIVYLCSAILFFVIYALGGSTFIGGAAYVLTVTIIVLLGPLGFVLIPLIIVLGIRVIFRKALPRLSRFESHSRKGHKNTFHKESVEERHATQDDNKKPE